MKNARSVSDQILQCNITKNTIHHYVVLKTNNNFSITSGPYKGYYNKSPLIPFNTILMLLIQTTSINNFPNLIIKKHLNVCDFAQH